MQEIDIAQSFLSKYSEFIQIGILGIFIPAVIWIWNKLKHVNIEISFSFGSSIICPNNSFTELKLINHTSKDFTIRRIDVVLFDEENKYILKLHDTPFKLSANDVKEIDIAKVSYYSIQGGDIVDIKNLLMSRDFYFKLNPIKRRFFVDKWYKNIVRRWKLLFLKSKTLSMLVFEIDGIIRSLEWEHVVRFDLNGKKEFCLFKRDFIVGPTLNLLIPVRHGGTFNPQLVGEILTSFGATNIQIKKLMDTNHIEPRKLGKAKYPKHTKGKVHTITSKDIYSLKHTSGVE